MREPPSSCAQSRTLEAKVPFAFEVGDKIVPAGSYQIESIPTGANSLQVIRNAKGDVQATLSTIPVTGSSANSGPELIFHRYGNRYFLSQIRTGDGRVRELLPSQQEKELVGTEPTNDIAFLGLASSAKP
jgi:hypothetical protein